jgi:hypothetical protein
MLQARSVECMQLDLQAAVILPLEDMSGYPAPRLILSTSVFAIGRPFRCAEEQISSTVLLDQLKLMTCHPHVEEADKELF